MVENYTSIKERLRQFAKKQGVSYEKLYKIIEMTDGSFKGNAINRSLNSDAIVKFYTNFPDVDLHWLITGEKKIEKEKENIVMEEPRENYESNYKDKYIEVLEENRELNKKLVAFMESNQNLKKDNKQISY